MIFPLVFRPPIIHWFLGLNLLAYVLVYYVFSFHDLDILILSWTSGRKDSAYLPLVHTLVLYSRSYLVVLEYCNIPNLVRITLDNCTPLRHDDEYCGYRTCLTES